MPANARFWVWHNASWVKLTLRPGQSLTAYEGGPTDEGWSYEASTYTHDGEQVTAAYDSQALDCDGRLDRYAESHCPLADLAVRDMYEVCPASENKGIMSPDWQRGSASQRDYEAERAGY